ncbi:MAG: hypothetical protein K2X02_07670 [Alphaproteobacteria bacterium]|nr:hypothetical protein [Alphaproteobacteria bacterium]
MKKINLLLKSFILISFLISTLKTQADPIDDYLLTVEKDFDSAPLAKRYGIVSKYLNLNYLCSLKSRDELDNNQLTSKVGPASLKYKDEKITWVYYNQTNPLALAISLGKRDLVSKFLSVVEDVNDKALVVWGYRQIYTLAHVALDPRYSVVSQNVPLENRLEIIDKLAKKGADFNKIIKWGGYKNPPLAAGDSSSFHLEDVFDPLRARALLHGANPSLRGSCFGGINLKEELNLLSLTISYYIEKEKESASLNPTEEVMAPLKMFMLRRKDFNLDKLLEKIAKGRLKREKLEDKIQVLDSRIDILRSKKTKKSKIKKQLLKMNMYMLKKNVKILNRKLNPHYKYLRDIVFESSPKEVTKTAKE